MKIKTTIKLLFTFAVLAGVFSCNADKFDSEFGGAVPYISCPCGGKPLSGSAQFQKGKAYLFKDSVPEQMKEQINNEMYSDPSLVICWIVYDSEADASTINFHRSDGMFSSGFICNFPDFAKRWNIPQSGYKIDFEGRSYAPCFSFDIGDINYVLTSLKRK